jgi:hypothetical protein
VAIDETKKSLSKNSDASTKAFVELYGQAYLETVIHWFKTAEEKL